MPIGWWDSWREAEGQLTAALLETHHAGVLPTRYAVENGATLAPQTITPNAVLKYMQAHNAEMVDGHQHDAHDLLMWLLLC